MSNSNKKVGEVVLEILNKNPCPQHHAHYSQYSAENQQILCKLCPSSQSSISISGIIDNPIMAMPGINSLLQSSTILDNIKKYKSWNKVNNGLRTLLSEIETKVKVYCENIYQQFNKDWELAMNNFKSQYEVIQNMQNNYRQNFQSLLTEYFIEGTPEELEKVVSEFVVQNEDPTQAFTSLLHSVSNSIVQIPKVNWGHLKFIYSTVTDPVLWKLSNSGNNSIVNNEKTLIPNFQNVLSDESFILKFNEDSISFYHKDEQSKLQTLSNECNDLMVELQRYKILGINYNSIKLYDYSLNHLKKEQQYFITGVTHYLTHKSCLILIANSKLIRLWLEDGKQEVLGFNYQLIKASKNPQTFICVNRQGRQEEKSFCHNMI